MGPKEGVEVSFSLAVEAYQEHYEALRSMRCVPSEHQLFDAFWSIGCPPEGSERRALALDSVRSFLQSAGADTAILFYQCDDRESQGARRQFRGYQRDIRHFADGDQRMLRSWLIDESGVVATGSVLVATEEISQKSDDLRGAINRQATRSVRDVESPDMMSCQSSPSVEEARDSLAAVLFSQDVGLALGGVRRLFVVPVLGIGTVPFAMLSPSTGSVPLVETTTVTILPSLFDILRPTVSPSSNFARSLIVGDPDLAMEHSGLPPLPGARAEAMAIGEMLGAAPLLGHEGSLAAIRVRAPDADLIYLAAHAVADSRDPLHGSFIALACGRWTAWEIQNSKLKAGLVVLSACQTGLGAEHAGGLIGLARAFTLAGAHRVVASLWNLDDQAIVPLLTSFIARLQQNLPAEALRLAMLEMKELHPDPHVWASLIVFGAS